MGIPPNYIDYTYPVIDQLYPQFSWRRSSPIHLDSAHGNFWSLYLGSQALHPNSENGRIDPNPFFPDLRDRKRIEKKNHHSVTMELSSLLDSSKNHRMVILWLVNLESLGQRDDQPISTWRFRQTETSWIIIPIWLDPLNTHSIAEVPVSIDPTFCWSACPLVPDLYIIFYQPRYPFLPIFLLKIQKKHIKNIKFQNLWSHFLGFHGMWFTLW